MPRRTALLIVLALVAVAGVARADIEEQRRRLPPPPPDDSCADAVEGEWQSLFWTQGWWLARTLHVHRASPGSSRIVGLETVETWDGARDAPLRPAACDPAAPVTWYTGESPLEGVFDGEVLDVHATRFDLGTVRCGRFSGYFPDHFRGPIGSAGTELQSTNDDAHNPETIVVFRRIACAQAAPPTPPPAPTARTAGCGCRLPGA